MSSVNPNSEQIAAMLASAGATGVINMINLLRFRAKANYPADHACARENLSGEQAYQRYMAATAPFIDKLGGRVVWAGAPNLVVIGPAEESWDLAFIVEYPSVAAMLSMLGDGEYQKIGIHRNAAVEDSRLIRCTPRTLS
jgi:uncharacterized protein (DUF1330 family)